ncbi:hypothetical protein [Beijerinckia sp. L45]|uniref:hypothetical protein n=1 Tax=Beijerinckia sp. L45 TaxID=1641855 RepID=UPI001AEEAC78|nr:hypothetical protein [Beijerinckia sp. L45]
MQKKGCLAFFFAMGLAGCDSGSDPANNFVGTWQGDQSTTFVMSSDGSLSYAKEMMYGDVNKSGTWSATNGQLTLTIQGTSTVCSYTGDNNTKYLSGRSITGVVNPTRS